MNRERASSSSTTAAASDVSAIAERPVALAAARLFGAGRLDYAASEDDLIALIARDSDSFNRWQAAQTYATRLLLRSVAASAPAARPEPTQASSTRSATVIEDAATPIRPSPRR